MILRRLGWTALLASLLSFAPWWALQIRAQKKEEKPAAPPVQRAANPEEKKKDENPEDKVKTNDYWQGRFKPVRAQLAKAEEGKQLLEDELNLLRVQQAREIAPEVQRGLQQKIAGKTAELETKRAATQKVKKALDELEEEFKKSGAPEEWSKAE